MKLNKYSWLAVLPLFFTACQDDMLSEKHSQQDVYTLTANMDGGTPDSRAQIILNGTSTEKETFHWNEGDQLMVYQLPSEDENGNTLSLSYHSFSIDESYSEETWGPSADFFTLDPLTVGREYVAFYPASLLDTESPELVRLEVRNVLPDNRPDAWVEYFKNNMFMMADGAVTQTLGMSSMSFEHICGIIRVTYKNTSDIDRTIEGLFVDGGWTTVLQYDLTDMEHSPAVVGNCAGHYGLTFQNGATIAAGETEDFYILYLAPIKKDVKPITQVKIQLSGNNFLYTKPYSKTLPVFEAGMSYWLNVTDNGKELLWTNEKQEEGDDSGEDSGEIQDRVEIPVTTFDELQKALATNANQINIFVKDDIELEAPLKVTHRTHLHLQNRTLSLSDEYKPGDDTSVFDVNSIFTISNGTLLGRDGSKLHDYYFALNGTQIGLDLNGVTINTGTAINHAAFMDDDHLGMTSIWVKDGEAETEIPCNIQTSGDAIHWVAKKAAPQMISYINGHITGNVYVESEFETLNAKMIFESGSISGKLNLKVGESLTIADYILKAQQVKVAANTGWEAAGLYVEDSEVYVSDFDSLKKALDAPQIADEFTHIYLKGDITLTEPLTINKPVTLHLQESALTLSDSFKWGTADAAITNLSDELEIYGRYNATGIKNVNGVIQGATLQSGKYLIKSLSNGLRLENVSLIAEDSLHAVYVEDADLYFEGKYQSIVSVGKKCYAMNMVSKTKSARIVLWAKTQITGNVGFTLDIEKPSGLYDESGASIINGDLVVSGKYENLLQNRLNGTTLTGNGWNDNVISALQEMFKNYGSAHTEQLTLKDKQVVSFTVGKIKEGGVSFDALALGGTGTIKFVNETEEEVPLYVDVQELGDGVNFEFEGKFRKIFNVWTTRVKEFFEMAEHVDQINVYLPDDVVLDQQIVTNKNLLWTDGSLGNEEQGMLALFMEGHTLTTSLNVPAILLQGGFLLIESGESGSGTIKTSTDFVQIGADADESNPTIELSMEAGITFSSSSPTWLCVNADGTAHKNVNIYINTETLTHEQRVAKVKVDESYTGKVIVCGVDKSNHIE